MNSIFISIITMGVLGAFFAYGLALARKKLKVEEDPRIDQVEEALPGANCGGCGYAGCRAFAEAVVAAKAEPIGCPVGGNETAGAIAAILGVEISSSEREVAFLMCRGTEEAASRKGVYWGINTCLAASILHKGDKHCSYGCLGYGDCEVSCPFDAIHVKEEGLPVVDKEKCTGCGQCVKACPKMLLELHPVSRKLFVFCKSQDNAKTSRQACKNACIACKICTRGSEGNEVVVENNLSIINDIKIMENEEAMTWIGKCPTKAIGFMDENTYKTPPPKPKSEKPAPAKQPMPTQ